MNSSLAKVASAVWSAGIIAVGVWAIPHYAPADMAPVYYILTGWAARTLFYR